MKGINIGYSRCSLFGYFNIKSYFSAHYLAYFKYCVDYYVLFAPTHCLWWINIAVHALLSKEIKHDGICVYSFKHVYGLLNMYLFIYV